MWDLRGYGGTEGVEARQFTGNQEEKRARKTGRSVRTKLSSKNTFKK